MIQYGGAIYWLLLFFCIYMITIFATEAKEMLRANLWTVTAFIMVFGFSSYAPDHETFVMAVIVYAIIGLSFAILKWISLVGRIRSFTRAVGPISHNDFDLRNLVDRVFKPNNVINGVMTLPPDPYEFRTRIVLWAFYWPSFTMFAPLGCLHRMVSLRVWTFFCQLSARIYVR